ncbi:MAG: hypothetical protein Q4C63_09730 [Eubacteriales bacterium]|nr:hypothetical protein [Eubacteriales bacterium]
MQEPFNSFVIVHYTLLQWLMFFYIYSFIGWIWESLYASVGQKRPVNRGFLHGPVIPIYGFGALCVLVSTIDVRESSVLVFFFGMFGATLLELVTGWAMEKLFHVKYWDYKNFPLNFHGYICLPASLAWGLFSVLMIRVIHVPIEGIVLNMRRGLLEPLAMIITAMFAVDLYQSVNEAMDLRDMLVKIEQSKEYIHTMQRRLEISSTVHIDDFKRKLRQTAECHDPFALRRNFIENAKQLRELRAQQLRELLSKAEEASKNLPYADERGKLKDSILAELERIGARGEKQYSRMASILGRNPHAVSEEHKDVFEEIRNMLK